MITNQTRTLDFQGPCCCFSTTALNPVPVVTLVLYFGDKRWDRYYYAVKDAKGKVRNMCEVAERLEKRGIEKGMEKGMEKGRLILLAQLVDDGTLSLHDAAIRAGMNDTDFKKTVEKLSSDISDK